MTKHGKKEIGQNSKTQSRGRTWDTPLRIAERSWRPCEVCHSIQNTDLLLAYVDAKREVETRLLMERAWKDHKKVAAPRVDGDGIMDYYYINSLDDLDPGSFGTWSRRWTAPSVRMRMD